MEDVGIHILWPFGLRYGHLVFTVIWYIYPVLVLCMYHKKSGNPDTYEHIGMNEHDPLE
jgi:hypothetical protein